MREIEVVEEGKIYNITLTRGDTLIEPISLYKEVNGVDVEYTPLEGDSIRFAMKRKYADSDEDIVLNINIPTDTMLLTILPEHTKPLTMGMKYVYDIQLTDANDNVDTFISGKFKIGNEVI